MKPDRGEPAQVTGRPTNTDDGAEILRRVMSACGYARGALVVKDTAGDGFSVAAHAGTSVVPLELLELLRETAIPTLAMSNRRVLIYCRRRQSNRALKSLSWRFGGDLVAVPLMPRDEALGVLLLGDRGQRLHRCPREQAYLLTVAGIAGLAWEQMQAGRQLWALDIGRRILLTAASKSCTSLRGLLEQVLIEAVHLLDVDAASIFLLEPATGDFVMQAQVGLKPYAAGRLRMPSAAVPGEGDGDYVGKTSAAPAEAQLGTSVFGVTPLLVDKMRLHKKTLGLVALYKRLGSGEPRPETRQILAALASEMAPTVAAAMDLQTDRELEDRLQQLVRHDANFTKLLSHQLRTPLTSIRGFAQLILRQASADPELIRKHVDIIFDKSGHLIDTIEEVRGLAAVTSDLLGLRKQPLFIMPLVRQVVASVEPFSRHHFELSLPAETALIRADQERISKVINILLCNAMRRSPSDLPIRVGVKSATTGVVVWVADHGPGPSRPEMDRAFKWGQPSDDSIEDDGIRSNSLALYACKRLVQAHGGRVWVEGEESETRFCFQLFC